LGGSFCCLKNLVAFSLLVCTISANPSTGDYMDKRYQVFVSSTFADLQEERRHVIQTLMEMDCIPSGMELFPAADEEQWEFIKKVIDDCDYYLLIIGGRYGSTTAEGISYTEKEYDYAIEKGIKVIALLHENPDEIIKGKSENDPKLVKKLEAFRKKVSTNRLVKFWKSADELAGLVALSLQKTIKMFPAVGWVKADQASNTQLLVELNEIRKQKEELETELAQLREIQQRQAFDLGALNAKVKLFGKYTQSSTVETWEMDIPLKHLFLLVSPYLEEQPPDALVKAQLEGMLKKRFQLPGINFSLDDHNYLMLRIQFLGLNLVKTEFLETTTGDRALFWSLTDKGYNLMLSLSIQEVKQDDE
jgi:hypothetical protein